ncbi:helix-turn-helix transcriptional regulator [Anaerotignum lactatifermentans]|uniref:Helix-turn-helix transcriptional regulator n=1 Tax=Anaerotignum lactatifermentans TaxID=160404 RepID=A0ABS2G7S2_9FIRM|nr:helix-turn-helix transcriptional regulator [Anaerotignum lactatifermentans]MBM6829142.1 helix-turn-helix transcriptional regulator [Anaerotignum lactatifermentans]MBM6877250.1 helix-turn-helix transcriptional regulator [Anaerotignum lactatifermentans]MBM6950623.1 helix-turn-helix transcriptional regulator [Anaerotignum lactatifermentans]
MPTDFAKNLRALRLSRRVTQAELAKALGYGYTAIANYESGRNEPSIGDLARIADFFQVSLDALVGRHWEETAEDFRWRLLSPWERRTVLDFMDQLAKKETGQFR